MLLLDAASRCLDDARQESITLETRLEAGYRAIMQLSMHVLWANGLSTNDCSGSSPHDDSVIGAFGGTHADQMLVLDTFRIKRDSISYTGEDMDIDSVEDCITAGEHLMQHVRDWLVDNRPDLAP